MTYKQRDTEPAENDNEAVSEPSSVDSSDESIDPDENLAVNPTIDRLDIKTQA